MFESDYNRHFSFLPLNTILYSNNLINPVGALDTPDDLILKYSSTRINTVPIAMLFCMVFMLKKTELEEWGEEGKTRSWK